MLLGESFKAPSMPSPPYPQTNTGFGHPAQSAPTPAQSAGYTYDMLVALRKIATFHKQAKLALFIEAAAEEARAILTSAEA
jgi:hypothetical protein